MKFKPTTVLSAVLAFLVDVTVLGVFSLIAVIAILANVMPRSYVAFAAFFQYSAALTVLTLVALTMPLYFIFRKIFKGTPGTWLCCNKARSSVMQFLGCASGFVMVLFFAFALSEIFIIEPQIYNANESHFIAEFAHEPQVHKTSFYNGDLNVDVHVYSVRSSLTDEQSVTLRRYSKPIPIDKFQSMAKVLMQEIVDSANLKVEAEQFSEDELFPHFTVDAEQKETGLAVHFRMVFDGDRSIYILSDVSLPNRELYKKFFKSFRIVK